mgnify:CR=1 FL=1
MANAVIVRRLVRRAVLLALALVLAAAALAHWITDWLWFRSLGYAALLVVPLAWQAALWAGVGLFTFAVLWVNVAAARPALARAYLRLETTPRMARSWSVLRRWVWAAIGLIAALWGATVAGSWLTVALWVHRRPFGIQDPLFGRDVGFYVFTLPFYRLALQVAEAAVVLSAGIVGLMYASAGMLAWRRGGPGVHGRARTHLLVLASVLLALVGAGSWLSRYDLLFSPGGVVYGATYADVHVRLPARAATAALLGVAAVLAAVAVRRSLLPAAVAATLAAAAGLGGELVAGTVQRLVVQPNELNRERPFLVHHIQATRQAYGLQAITETDFEVDETLTPARLQQAQELLANIRLWDWRPMRSTLAQLQVFRPYYDFLDVDVDRYRVGNSVRQVMVATRELNTRRLQNPSWVNLRLQYTHGYGLVMSPASEVTQAGLPRLVVRDIPPRSEPGWPQVRQPAIYIGQAPLDWVVVGTRAGEFDYPSGERNVFTRYTGRDGVSVGPLWARLLFAVRLRSVELLVSREIEPASRVLLYRNVVERLERLLPFVRYDPDPYVVVDDDGSLIWIVDAYTRTDRFPYARPVPGWGNYVRNAIKATVDAYHGTVRFYRFDDADPLAAALDRVFGGFLLPASAMPEGLRAHVRYPEQLFTVQAQVLAVYHMTSPDVFYNQEDRWELPREIYGETEAPMQAYYAMADLGDGEVEFTLLIPFTASGRQNMVAWMAARMDGERYGQLVLFRFPKQTLTYGPMQVEARINQDPDISRELTLWGQRGSSVLRGNLIVLPVGRNLLYVEPLFLVSEQSQLPELRRVVAATGPHLVMAPTLGEALAQLARRAAAVDPGEPAPGGVEQPGVAPPPPGVRPPELAGAGRSGLRQALAVLDEARRNLQQGDWEGFGRRMQELEAILREAVGTEPEAAGVGGTQQGGEGSGGGSNPGGAAF